LEAGKFPSTAILYSVISNQGLDEAVRETLALTG
jgi:hypothetical protein